MEKPKNLLDQFGGPKVEISARAGERDTRVMNGLRELGRGIAQPGMHYMGSFATHIYTGSSSAISDTHSIYFQHQQVGEKEGEGLSASVREFVVSQGVADLAVNLRIHFNADYEHKTTDPRDKR
jgi:hypothetical protein